ncbi:exodeoxyribonuclease VII large subunit [Defluviimonas sp. WL0075]|uniref:Exodeoxyribonuclease 7 large subunit n=1 Tax=Albidovulum sediminicola TaxID=2984331 RepID=A0ABT2Z242_9RHOB|nr:exodeoxyribonuclease VII large subunit [Defluviimonas sp. WL0075]MCV2865196.1 exodeoxyribonuclease VII large subunit [Defluviimonas sp. WL0075]
MDLLEDSAPRGNQPEYTVSEISGAVKRVIEGEFAHVRVRGEISRVSRPSSGHLYFDLKDDRAVIAAVSWKGQAARMSVRPEEGMEVIAIGRLTTFPGQSKYQLIVEDLVPAGAGALMVMLEKRKAALAAEGLFDAARKKPIPFLPGVIGVVTSPSGAVIRDILHRLRDRFPRRVLIWPVAVQGEKCAPEVAAAIRGFNELPADGPVPRPDLIIVARGGGSIEDLWGFNEEIVVRAAAASRIPLISAVGHETDTTLIDHASDRRAPTPTAAAEMAVPVRMELLAWASEQGARMVRATRLRQDQRAQRLSDLARALGRPEALLDPARQRFDNWSDRLGPALLAAATRKRAAFNASAARMQPGLLTGFIGRERRLLAERAERLAPALARLARDAGRDTVRRRTEVDQLGARQTAALRQKLDALSERLAGLDRMRQTLGYTETLRRGYAVVRGEGGVLTTRVAAEAAGALEIEFQDGRLSAVTGGGTKPKKPRDEPPPFQGSLF